jgi:hypothetical protein
MRKRSWTSFSIMMIFLAFLAGASCVPTRGNGAALPLDQNSMQAALTLSPPATPPSDWLTFTNTKYGFEFKYPKEGQILDGRTDNYARINLPFMPGTNLSEKYLEVIVVENVNPCRSPLGTSSAPQTSETVIINGISFLKETGEEGAAGNIFKWTAYSTLRDNACVSLDFVLHSINPDVFPTPPPLYDEGAESAAFGQIVSTYTWLTLLTATPTFTPASTSTMSPTSIPTMSATSTSIMSPTSTFTMTPTSTFTIDEEAVKRARDLSGQFIEIFGIYINPDGAKGLDAARIGGEPGQLAGMIAPVIDENQKYIDRENIVREVEGILSLYDSRLVLETMIIINKGTIQYPLLPLGAFMIACVPQRLNDCLVISLQREEFQIKPETISQTVLTEPVPRPEVAYEEGSIRKCFKVLRRKICVRVF